MVIGVVIVELVLQMRRELHSRTAERPSSSGENLGVDLLAPGVGSLRLFKTPEDVVRETPSLETRGVARRPIRSMDRLGVRGHSDDRGSVSGFETLEKTVLVVCRDANFRLSRGR